MFIRKKKLDRLIDRMIHEELRPWEVDILIHSEEDEGSWRSGYQSALARLKVELRWLR
jgi:hypothetical protein